MGLRIQKKKSKTCFTNSAMCLMLGVNLFVCLYLFRIILTGSSETIVNQNAFTKQNKNIFITRNITSIPSLLEKNISMYTKEISTEIKEQKFNHFIGNNSSKQVSSSFQDSAESFLPQVTVQKGSVLFNGSVWKDPNSLTNLLVFIHIPKNSGESFKQKMCQITGDLTIPIRAARGGRAALGMQLRPVFHEGKGIFTQFPACNTHSWEAPGCASPAWTPSHCGYDELLDCLRSGKAKGKLPELNDRRPLFSTVLREPVERVISEYYWWQKKSFSWKLSEASTMGGVPLLSRTPRHRSVG